MKIDKAERKKQALRVVDYFIPRCRLRLTYYYYRSNRQLWACWKRLKVDKWMLIRPTIKFENDAAMLMFETYLAALFKTYKSPRHCYRPGSYRHGQFVWRDILDRYVGGDLSSKTLILGWHSVQTLVKEMKAYGKFPEKEGTVDQ